MRSNLGTGPNGCLPQPIELRPAEMQRVAGAAQRCPYRRRIGTPLGHRHGNGQAIQS